MVSKPLAKMVAKVKSMLMLSSSPLVNGSEMKPKLMPTLMASPYIKDGGVKPKLMPIY